MRKFLLSCSILVGLASHATTIDSITLPIHVMIDFDGKNASMKAAIVSANDHYATFDSIKNIFTINLAQDSLVTIKVGYPGYKTAQFGFVAHYLISPQWLSVQLAREGCRYLRYDKNVMPVWPDSMRIGIIPPDIKETARRKKLNLLFDSLGLMFTDTARAVRMQNSQCYIPYSVCIKKDCSSFSDKDVCLKILREQGFITGIFLGKYPLQELYFLPLTIKPSNYVSAKAMNQTLTSLHLNFKYLAGNDRTLSVMPDDLSMGIGILDIFDQLMNSGQFEYVGMNGCAVHCLD